MIRLSWLLLPGCLLGPADRDAFEDRDGDGSPWTEDCDDADAQRHPGADEICGNRVDDDCSGDATGCALTGRLFVESTAAGGVVGEWDDERVGSVVRAVGDLDHDGVVDWIVGGRSRVVLGHGAIDEVLGAEAVGVLTTAGTLGDVVGVGDLDGDGVDDLAVAAPPEGLTYVSTATGDPLGYIGSTTDYDVGFGLAWLEGLVAVGGAEGVDGMVWIFRPELAPTSLDDAVAAVRVPDRDVLPDVLLGADLDGDGVEELIVGAPGANAMFVLPHDLTGAVDVAEAAVAALVGESRLDQAGASVAVAGDVDGDGLPDLLVGAPQRSGTVGTGVAYLIEGPFAGEIGLQGAVTVFLGAAEGDGAGWSVAGLGDMDGADTPDVAIGAPFAAGAAAEATGIVYVVYDPQPGTVNLADADLALYGGVAHEAGRTVVGPGDLDGDGYADLIVGAPLADPGEVPVANGGAAWFVLGAGL